MNGDRATPADLSGNVDRLLRDFFRSELPEPWPACPLPTPRKQHNNRRRFMLRRSYVGLAACMVFLGVGLLLAVSLLRFDRGDRPESGILPSAARPVRPGGLFRTPPATSPQPHVLQPGTTPMDDQPQEPPPMLVPGPRNL